MALTNTPKRRWFRAGAFLFSLSPAIVLANLIARYSVNLPVMDDWPIGWFLFKSLNGDFSFAHLLAQANESRPVFPRLLFLSLAYVAGWDVRYQMALTLLFALLISYNLYRLCSITVPGNRSHRLILIFFVNLLVFSPIQYQNWFWGIQTIVFIPIFCLSTALLVSYTSCSAATKTLSAIVLSTISTFSYANGMICWVLIPPALFFQRRESTVKSTWWRLIYSVAMIFNVLLYFSNYQKPPYHPLLDYALSHLCQAFSYFGSSRECVQGFWKRQLSHAVVQVPDIVLCSSESIGFMADDLGLVVEPFDGAIVDRHPEVVHQVALVAAQHPGELAHGRYRLAHPA